MPNKQFEYGPVARGTYYGLISVSIVMPLLGPNALFLHLLLLLFLGFGLRPLLEKTGLYRSIEHALIITQEKTSKNFMEKRRFEIERKNRDEGFRKRRLKHPDLPKDW